MIYNIVLVAALPHSDSVIHRYVFFSILFSIIVYHRILFFIVLCFPQYIPGYWIHFPMLSSRTLLFIYSLYNNLHLLIPNSQSLSPHLFICFLAFYIFGEMFLQDPCHLKLLLLLLSLLSCKSSFYILDINPLSCILFANIFYSSVGCLLLCWLFPLVCRSFKVWYHSECLFLLFLLLV